MPKAPKPAPLSVGDTVRCVRPHSPLDGLPGRVVGLRVRSCDGRVGIAVQYSARGYVVMDPNEVTAALPFAPGAELTPEGDRCR